MGMWQEFIRFVAQLTGATGGVLLVLVGLMRVLNGYGMGGVILALFALSLVLSVAARILERRGR